MKTLAFFNNKGGVGKTTLTCNVVSYLNQHKLARVLLVDADPQCNATQAILDENVVDTIYFGSGEAPTLYDYCEPLNKGEPTVLHDITVVSGNSYGCDIVPGHPRMSLIEDRLSRAWTDFQGAQIGGFRICNWVSQLLSTIGGHYDLIVFDVGPSLGALNRTILLSCDYVVTPFGSDIFSLLGIQNIASWIDEWSAEYQLALQNTTAKYKDTLGEFPGVTDLSTRYRFAGYSVQQYVKRTFKAGKRPVKAYEEIMKEIPGVVRDTLGKYIAPGIRPENLELGHIPFVYSLAPLAQSNHVPIHMLKKHGLVTGNQYKQVDDYERLMKNLCDKLCRNIGLKND